jgi:hypothetical protein
MRTTKTGKPKPMKTVKRESGERESNEVRKNARDAAAMPLARVRLGGASGLVVILAVEVGRGSWEARESERWRDRPDLLKRGSQALLGELGRLGRLRKKRLSMA